MTNPTIQQALRQLIANDAYAMAFQSIGQYRTALLKHVDGLLDVAQPESEAAADELLDMLGRVHPYAMPMEDFKRAEERLQRAVDLQQPLPVPDQAAIVWRGDLMQLIDELQHKRSVFEDWKKMRALHAAAPGTLLVILRDVHDTLASESDIDHFEDDDEEREVAPVQYAARKVMEVIDLIKAAAVSAPGIQEAPHDPVVEANRQLLLDRSRVGLVKYGTPLEATSLSHAELTQHALEEALDLANYLQAILRKQHAAQIDVGRGEKT